MNEFHVPAKKIQELITESSNGIVFRERILYTYIVDDENILDKGDLIVLPRFGKYMPRIEDTEACNEDSWLTGNIADIIERYSQDGLDFLNTVEPDTYELVFKKLEEDQIEGRVTEMLNAATSICADRYGIDLSFQSKRIDYVYEWNWINSDPKSGEESINITLLRINANYVFLVSFFIPD